MSDDPLLHIGYVKTATTYLQERIFSEARLGFGLPGGRDSRAELVQQIVLADDYVFDPSSARARLSVLEDEVRGRGLIPVWSDETLLGDPMVRRYDGPANAIRLAQVFPTARVLITIREQRAVARSIYSEFVRQGGRETLEQVIGTGAEQKSFTPILRPEFLMFDRAVRRYLDVFGAERVLVLPQEWLRKDPAAYFDALSAFTGRNLAPDLADGDRNSALGGVAQASLRRLNHLFVRNPLSPRRPRMQKLSMMAVRTIDRFAPARLDTALAARQMAAIDRRYADTFRQSNTALAALTGLSLADLGYLLQRP